jgi:hypothetical protein
MARQDIHVDAAYGEVSVTDNLANKEILDFTLLDSIEGLDNDNCCYGEIAVPGHPAAKPGEGRSLYVRIPYHPVYRELSVRLKVDDGGGIPGYILNRSTNRVWFPVYSGEGEKVMLSELRKVNEAGVFHLVIRGGGISLFSGSETDFIIKAALKQNEIFLLKAFAGNLYQYPTTGVGLIDFLHGNFEDTGLAGKLQSEFASDRMVIDNAAMDSQTGELLLDITEKDG